MAKIKLMALGGQDEHGKNLYVLEIDDAWFILDAGIKYPDKGILGVDIVIPKLNLLKNNRNKIKGIFLTDSSSYNMGAVPYILKKMDIPVYCNEITQLVGKIKILRMRIKNIKDQNFKVVKDKKILKFDNVKVEVFRTTSSSPQSFGYAFYTDSGIIVYAGDYIIDGKEQSYFSTNLNHLSEIGKKGVLALIADSEFASRDGFTVPNHKIEGFISAPFKEKKTKIAIVIFEEDIFKLSEICILALENNRKIAVYGRTLMNILKSNLINKNLKITSDHIISVEEYMQSENSILIISGTGDILYSKLAKIATGNDKVVEFKKNDLIILATPPAAGIEKRHAQILDELARTDARLIALSDRNLWSMHASYEDVKVFISLFNPKYFIPVKSLYKDSLCAKKAAIEAGIDPQNIIIFDNGQIVNISEKYIIKNDKKIDVGNTYVDGAGISDVGASILNDRKLLATDGVIVVGATIDSLNKELFSMIDIQMRGVLYIKEQNPIFKILQKKIENLLIQGQNTFKEIPNKYNLNEIKKEIASKVRLLIKHEFGKQPIILVIINEYDGKEYIYKPQIHFKKSNHNNKQ